MFAEVHWSMRKTNLNDGEFRRFFGETAVPTSHRECAEFSAKPDSDFCARLSNAVVVTTRLPTFGTAARSS